MKPINPDTKIAVLLKQDPRALEAIISLSPRFEKLRNPLLRKLMAGRTSIQMASRIGGVNIRDFLSKLEALGFYIEGSGPVPAESKNRETPDFLKDLPPDRITELDVRPEIETGKDPLHLILQRLKDLKPGQVLKLVNSFEPVPLIELLQKQGYESHVEEISPDLVITWFYATRPVDIQGLDPAKTKGWEILLKRFDQKMQTLDVRQLEMPLPMLTILEALETLPPDQALYVYHKRIPLFLLPELAERHFDYRIKEVSDQEVHLLLFRS
ncbi:MAG TPA: DUF2249 domain-containing protein [Saprospiraceae bacterium]|nr:DUF2249 domain-containing protein [Saprospiraceae bacterium]HNT20408.1 DUF2249 domain-containing protein [Saprospiraceae bacterium]